MKKGEFVGVDNIQSNLREEVEIAVAAVKKGGGGSVGVDNIQSNLREEVEIVVAAVKKWESAGVDNTLAELAVACRQIIIYGLTEIRNKIWRTGECSTPWL